MHSLNRNVVFEIDGTILESSGILIKYLGAELIMYTNRLTMNANNRNRKFNFAAYVLLKMTDPSDLVKCELEVKK